jgi:branched-chain amino acid transport system substrate-binding protein
MNGVLPAGGARIACLALVLAAVLAGCGTSGTVQGGNDTYSATTLTVYSDLPLLGPDGVQMTSIVNGEVLALYDQGGHVGKLHVSLESLNDYPDGSVSDPLLPDPLRTLDTQIGESAHTASSDLSTAAYIGDYDSDATWISLPLNNQNDILQVSPGSSYVGFTDANPADLTGDPGAFYGYGTQTVDGHIIKRTFARLDPSDLVQAHATLTWMRSLGVRRLAVIEDASNPAYDSVIAKLVAAAAPSAGITVVASRSGVDTATLTSPGSYAAVADSLAGVRPDAVLLGGIGDAGAPALWRELHKVLAQAKLFAPSTLATPAFLAGLGASASATYVTSPILEPSQYGAAAQRVFAQYRSLFGAAPSGYVLYGYDAMRDILLAIAKAGPKAANRPSLLAAFFALGRAGFTGALGDYRINADGDSSLTAFDGYRVSRSGALVLAHAIP